mgnify:CR=1 FL=1
MSIVFTEVRIEDRGGVELSFMEGGCLDELDIRELLKHDQPFRCLLYTSDAADE